MSRSKYLAKNTALFALGNIGTKMISFFLVPLYTHALNTGEYGIIDLVTTIVTFLAPIITFNIGASVMRFSLDRDSDKEKNMSIGLLFSMLCLILGFAVLPFLWNLEMLKEYAWYVYLFVVTSGISQIFICNLRGREQLLDYAISNILHTLAIALTNILLLLRFHMGIKGYFTAYIVSNLITILYCTIRGNVIYTLFHFRIDKDLLKAMSSYSMVLIPTSFMWWIMNSSDRIMVTAMIGVTANGIYAISYKVPTLLSTLSIVFNQAWSYSAIKENESEDREAFNNLVYDKMVHTLSLATAGMIMLMKPFLHYYVNPAYYEAWKYTPYLIIGFLFMTLGSFLSTSYTVYKDSKGFLYSGMFGAVINVILNFLLIPIIGVAGAAFATCISYISVFVFRCFHTRKYIYIHVLRKDHFIDYCFLLIMAGTMFIDTFYGQLLLCLEFLFLLLMERNTFLELFHFVFKRRKTC